MWKKDDAPKPEPRTPRREMGESPVPEERPDPTPSGEERAAIGRSIKIRGEVSGNEDLLIQGEIDGSVDLEEQAVTVGEKGTVKADIRGRVITVEGQVEGNLDAREQVILRSSAEVEGDITAPRVVLEDGARFRGGIDMGAPEEEAGKEGPRTSRREKKPGSMSDRGPGSSSDSAADDSEAKGGSKTGNGTNSEKRSESKGDSPPLEAAAAKPDKAKS